MSNRRASDRIPIQVAVTVTSVRSDAIGVTRDVSARGLLMHSLSRFSVGDRVSVQFRAADVELTATGRVVRTSREPERWTMFPNVAAVEFDGEVPAEEQQS